MNIQRLYEFVDVAGRFVDGNVSSHMDDFDEPLLFPEDVIQI
jgi:hypothetical protein